MLSLVRPQWTSVFATRRDGLVNAVHPSFETTFSLCLNAADDDMAAVHLAGMACNNLPHHTLAMRLAETVDCDRQRCIVVGHAYNGACHPLCSPESALSSAVQCFVHVTRASATQDAPAD